MADDCIVEDARLIILRELARQSDGRANDILLARVLDAYGLRRSRDWLRTQLRRLADLDAARLDQTGEIFVATLRKAGRDHVDRRALIEGVAAPADED